MAEWKQSRDNAKEKMRKAQGDRGKLMEQKRPLIAHRKEDGETQLLTEHLEDVAGLAGEFAADFGCRTAGEFCGRMHDIGKSSESCQNRMYDPEKYPKVDHSTAGAKEALHMSMDNLPLAEAIASHHSGLLDVGNASAAEEGTFFRRLRSEVPDYGRWENEIYPRLKGKERGLCPAFCAESAYSMSFFIRMLYSCLVDADYLDTERFLRGEVQRGGYRTREELLKRFEKHISAWKEGAEKVRKAEREGEKVSASDRICVLRTDILSECMEGGGKLPRGLYTLTVPTGGGKTTASLGFALKQICSQGMRRIIYVIPYTSVIDQNAEVFKKILGEENVLEHHSGILYDPEEGGEEQQRKALATENWDAPVIVTTAVQFFESLYGSRSSVCRKIHNLSNSVIIFDEAQTLPLPYLEPCVAAIAELVKNYRSTAVLCTATQPALETMFQKYLPQTEITELCSHTEVLFRQLERVNIQNAGELSVQELEERLRREEQILCVVNTRRIAQKLYQDLRGEGVYCLTTLLCPAVRKIKFAEIKERLCGHEKCIVIATSLVEAGVDLDFCQVYRQEAGLDALIQAAGRCNREGKRTLQQSQVYSFVLQGEKKEFQAQPVAALREVRRRYEKVNSQESISFYFQYLRDLLGTENLDQKGIMKLISGKVRLLPFRTVAEKFKLIESSMRTVYIPLTGTEKWLRQIAEGNADRNTFRRLGQYAVTVHEQHFRALWEAGCLEELHQNVFVLRDRNQYDDDTGLQMDVETGFGVMI